MSRRFVRCRNGSCPVPHGAVLGRLTGDGGLELDRAEVGFRVYLDTGRTVLRCPACGTERDFLGTAIFSARSV